MPAARLILRMFEKALPRAVLDQPLRKHRPLRQLPAPHRELQHAAQRRSLPVHRRRRRPRRPAQLLVPPHRVARDRRRRPAGEHRPEVRHPAARRGQRAQPPHGVVLEIPRREVVKRARLRARPPLGQARRQQPLGVGHVGGPGTLAIFPAVPAVGNVVDGAAPIDPSRPCHGSPFVASWAPAVPDA